MALAGNESQTESHTSIVHINCGQKVFRRSRSFVRRRWAIRFPVFVVVSRRRTSCRCTTAGTRTRRTRHDSHDDCTRHERTANISNTDTPSLTQDLLCGGIIAAFSFVCVSRLFLYLAYKYASSDAANGIRCVRFVMHLNILHTQQTHHTKFTRINCTFFRKRGIDKKRQTMRCASTAHACASIHAWAVRIDSRIGCAVGHN